MSKIRLILAKTYDIETDKDLDDMLLEEIEKADGDVSAPQDDDLAEAVRELLADTPDNVVDLSDIDETDFTITVLHNNLKRNLEEDEDGEEGESA